MNDINDLKITDIEKLVSLNQPIYMVDYTDNVHDLTNCIVLKSKNLNMYKLTLNGIYINENGAFITVKELDYFHTGFCIDITKPNWSVSIDNKMIYMLLNGIDSYNEDSNAVEENDESDNNTEASDNNETNSDANETEVIEE